MGGNDCHPVPTVPTVPISVGTGGNPIATCHLGVAIGVGIPDAGNAYPCLPRLPVSPALSSAEASEEHRASPVRWPALSQRVVRADEAEGLPLQVSDGDSHLSVAKPVNSYAPGDIPG